MMRLNSAIGPLLGAELLPGVVEDLPGDLYIVSAGSDNGLGRELLDCQPWPLLVRMTIVAGSLLEVSQACRNSFGD